ncbi:MAG: aminoacyl-tRNA hydrolase [Clostridia bacterium]|nr:aminoacyl-tRNA hydrolase [Clostridia bacterium]
MFFRKSKATGPIDFLIVGLGNPGKEYAHTRHNAGCIALEELSRKLGVTPDRLKFKGQCGEAIIGDRRVLLLFPLTFMNNSGEAVAEAMRFYKLTPEQLVVMSDDVSLDVGTVRIRRKGSDGGQKGLRSIIEHLGTQDFARIKIGVGQKPHPDYDMAAWVLSRFTESEKSLLKTAAENAADAACLIAKGDIDSAMNRYSR